MSFGERNWHGIVRGQGYVRVLAGRARSDMLRMTQRLTQRKNFCTTHFLFQNQSFVDFTEKSEHLDVRWGRSWWKWQFSLSKTCCALTVFNFIYTKNFARPRSDFTYTKNFARPGSDFTYTKNSGAARAILVKKRVCIWKKFPAARAILLKKSCKKKVCIGKNFPAARAIY